MTCTLIIGGTGAMGSRVVRRLLDDPDANILLLTRDPASDHARQLAALEGDRLRLVHGDVNDVERWHDVLRTADQVFCNTDFFSSRSALAEYRQGLALLEASRAAGVSKFIWSSLDSAVALTGGRICVPHYDGKAAVAAHINLLRSEEMMRKVQNGWYSEHVSILTTSPYFENLQLRLAPRPGRLPDDRSGLIFSIPLGSGKYPLVALDDIAWFATFMFGDWQSWGARDLAIVGDSLGGDEIAATFERSTGIPSAYVPVPLDLIRTGIPDVGHDFAAMFEFFQERDVYHDDRDVRMLRTLHPDLMDFEAWLRRTGWEGAEQGVQKFPIHLPAEARSRGGHERT